MEAILSGSKSELMKSPILEKITIPDTDHLSDSWFKTEILGGLNSADVEFIDPSTHDGEYRLVAAHLTTPRGLD